MRAHEEPPVGLLLAMACPFRRTRLSKMFNLKQVSDHVCLAGMNDEGTCSNAFLSQSYGYL